jgi:hypothetical protein
MTQGSPGAENPFAVTRHPEPSAIGREATRTRRLSIPLRMDDGQVKSFEVPCALEQPTQFSVGEFERLTRAYAEALGLLSPGT